MEMLGGALFVPMYPNEPKKPFLLLIMMMPEAQHDILKGSAQEMMAIYTLRPESHLESPLVM